VGWKFWQRKTALTTESEDGEELPRLPAPSTAPPPAPDAPSMQGFSFEGPIIEPPPLAEGDTDVVRSMPQTESIPERVEVERVVRRKAAGRRGVDVRSLGVGPVWVPSLREQAIGYRLAAAREEQNSVARDFYAAYLDLCPDDGVAWFNYGQILLGERRLEQAWGAFESAFESDPTDGLAAGALGYLSSVRGDYPGAVERYTRAVALRPGCRDMLSGLADAQLAAGRTADAARTRAEIERLDAL
jgi:hypothetical protein